MKGTALIRAFDASAPASIRASHYAKGEVVQYLNTGAGSVFCRMSFVHQNAIDESSNAKPLVMLHQTASSSKMFSAVMQAFVDERCPYITQVFAPDTPGFGGSVHLN